MKRCIILVTLLSMFTACSADPPFSAQFYAEMSFGTREFLKSNLSWIKDLAMLVFAGIGSVVAIKTYRRARATVLQPVRTEVIKKQSELLSELLRVCHDIHSADLGLDYKNIVAINVLHQLSRHGFIFSNPEEIAQAISSKRAGAVVRLGVSRLSEFKVVGTFDEIPVVQKPVKEDEIQESKRRYDDAKNGLVAVETVFYTNEYQAVLDRLTALQTNPFMPQTIADKLKTLISEIRTNISEKLPELLEHYIRKYFQRWEDSGLPPPVNPDGVYNDFNRTRIHHNATVEMVLKASREYLMVDEPWE